MPAQTFGRYEILGLLGTGGFADVFRAREFGGHAEVALKALLPHMAADSEIRALFYGEWQALAVIRHRNIVALYDAGEAEGRPFFTMEMIDGHTLADAVAYGHGLPLEQVLDVARALGSALDWLHAAGLVHRDLKAANVMRDQYGRVVLMDFGIVHGLDSSRYARAGSTIGTVETMAPEQIRRDPITHAVDIYSFGILMYQLLGGRLPFIGNTAHVQYAQVHQKPPPLREARAGLPESIYRAIDAALEKQPRHRPSSAGEFAAALAGLPAPSDVAYAPPPVTTTGTTVPPARQPFGERFRQLFGSRPGRLAAEPVLTLTGPGGARVPLAPGVYTLGRDPSCEIRLDDGDVSRFHARLTISNGAAVLEDLNSTNGTFVNGAAVGRTALYPGDVIRAGWIDLEVMDRG